MKKTLAIISILMMTVSASAQTFYEREEDLKKFKEAYNNQSSKVPSFIGNIVGGETVNINFKSNGTSKKVGVKFEGFKIQNISDSGFKEPTMRANVTQSSVESIIKSEKPYQELQEKLEEEEITYESTNIGGSIKIKIFETLSGLASVVGLSL